MNWKVCTLAKQQGGRKMQTPQRKNHYMTCTCLPLLGLSLFFINDNRYGDTGEKQELLPQYAEEKKEEGLKLGQ